MITPNTSFRLQFAEILRVITRIRQERVTAPAATHNGHPRPGRGQVTTASTGPWGRYGRPRRTMDRSRPPRRGGAHGGLPSPGCGHGVAALAGPPVAHGRPRRTVGMVRPPSPGRGRGTAALRRAVRATGVVVGVRAGPALGQTECPGDGESCARRDAGACANVTPSRLLLPNADTLGHLPTSRVTALRPERGERASATCPVACSRAFTAERACGEVRASDRRANCELGPCAGEAAEPAGQAGDRRASSEGRVAAVRAEREVWRGRCVRWAVER